MERLEKEQEEACDGARERRLSLRRSPEECPGK